MLRIFLFILAISLIVPLLAKASDYKTLDITDFIFEKASRERPAVTSVIGAIHPFESFNKWLCFDRENMEVRSIEILDSTGTKHIPILLEYESNGPGRTFQFEASSLNLNLASVLAGWAYVISGVDEVCILSAEFQEFDDGLLIRLLNRIKTKNGYWIESQINEEACGTEFKDFSEGLEKIHFNKFL